MVKEVEIVKMYFKNTSKGFAISCDRGVKWASYFSTWHRHTIVWTPWNHRPWTNPKNMNKRDKLIKFSKTFMDGLNNQDLNIGIYLLDKIVGNFSFFFLYIKLTKFAIFGKHSPNFWDYKIEKKYFWV